MHSPKFQDYEENKESYIFTIDLLFYNPILRKKKKNPKIERLNWKPLDLTKKKWKEILSFTTWLVNEFFSSSHFDVIKTFKYWFPQNRWFYKERNFFKMMLEFRKDWKDLAFVGGITYSTAAFYTICEQKSHNQMFHYWCRPPHFSSKMLKNLKEQGFCRKV